MALCGWALPAALLVPAAAVLLLLRRSRRFAVEGNSMKPSLEPGDWVIVTPLPHWANRLCPNWLVVARRPDRPEVEIVKRIAEVDGKGEAVTLLGDNLAASTDSREFGAVPMSAVVGVAWLRYWPPNRIGFLLNPGGFLNHLRRSSEANWES